MSTRSIIGKPDGEGIAGVYHHTDGYPTGMGAFTFRLIRHRFHGDVSAFVAEIIDAHPGGWSNLYGFVDGSAVCYCHDPAFLKRDGYHPFTASTKDHRDCGAEWAYSFDAESHTMGVMELHGEPQPDGTHTYAWKPVAIIDLDGPEPDWWAMEGEDAATYEPSFVDKILAPA